MKTFVFDTETTDLVKNRLLPLERQPRIIEFFGLMLDNEGKELSAHHFLIDPERKLSEETRRITGIQESDLVGKPSFSSEPRLAQEIKSLIESADEVVAHNLSFDKSMVDIEMKRLNLSLRWPRLICTVEATEHIKGFRLSLSSLHELLFGEAFTGAHRAENDVRALARCFVQLRATGIV
jgi:DNA polymerase III epsilon subunit-like protein